MTVRELMIKLAEHDMDQTVQISWIVPSGRAQNRDVARVRTRIAGSTVYIEGEKPK